MVRTFVIGDIHGGLKALSQLITMLHLKKGDRLIFLGDYVDGWSESSQVIDYLNEIDQMYPCVFIKGNHDIWCQEWLNSGMPNPQWLYNGGRSTVDSYNGIDSDQKMVHLEFFERMKNYYIDDANRLFIHAGFSSMHGPAQEPFESNFYWDRTLWEVALSMDKGIKKDSPLFPKRLSLFNEIYIGHTPTVNYNVYVPMNAGNVWNIDTGAAYNGKLSALNIDTKEIWQSDPVQKLYPAEKGRNK
ncbi:MAG: metallophosphoesterase family protein [Agriterribacter sp.]